MESWYCKWGQGIAGGVRGVANLGPGRCACHTRQPKAESTLSTLDLSSRNHCAQCYSGSALAQAITLLIEESCLQNFFKGY